MESQRIIEFMELLYKNICAFVEQLFYYQFSFTVFAYEDS